MGMGRKRKHDTHLPKRVYIKRGSYQYVDASGKSHTIGRVSKPTNKYPVVAIWEVHKWIKEHTQFPSVGSNPLINDIFNKFENRHVPTLSKGTQRGYKTRLIPLRLAFGMIDPESLTKKHIYQYREARLDSRAKNPKLSIAEINKEVGVLSSAMSKGIEYGLVSKNVCIGIKKLDYEREEVKDVTDEQFMAVYSVMRPMMQAAMWIYFLTGKRRTELLRLKIDDIQEEGIIFTLNKKKKTTKQVIEWSDQLRKAVQFALDNRPHHFTKYLICTLQGNKFADSGDGFYNNFRRGVDRAIKKGLLKEPERFTIQSLRKMSSIRCESLARACELLGHENSQVTQAHYRLNRSKVKPLL